jgi:hypothetical protein
MQRNKRCGPCMYLFLSRSVLCRREIVEESFYVHTEVYYQRKDPFRFEKMQRDQNIEEHVKDVHAYICTCMHARSNNLIIFSMHGSATLAERA